MSELHQEIRDANAFARDHQRTWEAERRELAARMQADVDTACASLEKLLRGWAKDDLLKLSDVVPFFDGQRWVAKDTTITVDERVKRIVEGFRETLTDPRGDTLSLTALEAIDVAEQTS